MIVYRSIRKISALTMIEVVVILAVALVPIFVVMFWPRHRAPTRAQRIHCTCNLKQVGLAFHTWALDHNEQFPMEASTNVGGTLELGIRPYAFAQFRVLSNELSTPKILVCPADSKRSRATDFSPGFNNWTISYFVGADASFTNGQMFLSGDRNITNSAGVNRGLLGLTTNDLSGWTDEMHCCQGNVGLADGSVQQLSRSRLREAIGFTGIATNRLAMP